MDIEHEKSEIQKTIQLFFVGFDNHDAELISKAFYSGKAEMFSIRESSGKINKTPINNWSKIFESVKSQPNNIWNKERSRKNIVYIDITGLAASAKVEYIFSAYKYTDYYNLLKIEGQWCIVNKTFDTMFFEQ
jgi:hypothetical protein